MLAAAALRDARVAVLLVPREETDHAGMAAAHAFGVPANVTLVNAEPTQAKLVERQKGMLKVLLKADGVSAHSGYPHLGRSAVHDLVQVVSAIVRTWPDTGETNVNVGVIQGGTAPNVLAAEATARLLWRVSTSVSQVVSQLEQILSQHEHVSYEIITRNEPVTFHVPAKAALRFGTAQVAYNTDVPYYKGGYKNAVLFGAGSIEQAHTQDEWICIEQLQRLPQQMQVIVSELLES
ncbi:Peptidase M20 [Gracilaria domingensis]|nr:Peptidase M20 [Gracilaria domingensis]